MVKEVTYKEIREKSPYRRGLVLTFPPFKSTDLFFEIDKGQADQISKHEGAGEYLESVQRGPLPPGVHGIKSLDNGRYFLVICDKTAHKAAIAFAQSLFA